MTDDFYVAQLETALRAHRNLQLAKKNLQAAAQAVTFWQQNLNDALSVLASQPIKLPRNTEEHNYER